MITLPAFPMMVRRLWSGSDVQQWIDAHIRPTWEQLLALGTDEEFPLAALQVADVYHAGSETYYRALLGRALSPAEVHGEPPELEAPLVTLATTLDCAPTMEAILAAIHALQQAP